MWQMQSLPKVKYGDSDKALVLFIPPAHQEQTAGNEPSFYTYEEDPCGEIRRIVIDEGLERGHESPKKKLNR